MEDRAAIEQAALSWHHDVEDGSVDWDAFTLWLEAAPAHAHAYDTVALADALLRDHAARLAAPVIETTPAPRQRWRPVWPLATSLAASLAALVWWQAAPAPTAQITQTADTPRNLALADGTQIALAPHSRLEQRGAAFALTGDAVFDVPHRPGRTMTITGADLTIRDIGTRFEVTVEPQAVRLSVAEGQVAVTVPGTAPIALVQGHALLWRPAAAQLTLSANPHARIGTWRKGELSYNDAPLDLVASDIARYGGTQIALAPTLANTHFTGTLLLGHGHSPAQDLAQLLGATWRPDVGRNGGRNGGRDAGRLLPGPAR